jgi:hypothetical protein
VPFFNGRLDSLLFGSLVGVHTQIEDFLFSHISFFFFIHTEKVEWLVLCHDIHELFLLGFSARDFNL